MIILDPFINDEVIKYSRYWRFLAENYPYLVIFSFSLGVIFLLILVYLIYRDK